MSVCKISSNTALGILANADLILKEILNKAKKNLDEYIDKIIVDINALRQRKIQELDEEHLERDQYMEENQQALNALGEEIDILLK